MLDSGNQALFNTLHEVLCKVAPCLLKLMKIDCKMRQQYQLSKFKMAIAAMLDSGNQAFSTPWTSFYSKSENSYQIWWHLVKKWRNSISFSKFKMATAAILDSSHQAFFDSIHVLAFKVSTFIPIRWSLVKIERTESVLLNSRWRWPSCLILANGRFWTPWISLYSQSQHFYQI